MAFKTKQDQVADILRERIIAGTYPRGTKLKQSQIAEELGVSITPVREALHTLEAEGYVAGVSHKGLLVPDVVPDATREIFELRVLLERELADRAMAAMTRKALAELREIQARIVSLTEAATDPQATRAENYRFHFRLYELAQRPQTLQFVRVLWAKYPFISQEYAGRRKKQIAEHERFLTLAEAGNREGAVQALVDHIEAGWAGLNSTPSPVAAEEAPVAEPVPQAAQARRRRAIRA
ncbi:GntR family transcriptional regulator [Roseomonas sp. OT10]|uniref:GntR family transcriptional regulator n=1 Tax=Roseomonas cutis TaxID=2897332 RepID=UPI001E2FB81B|nr:GntR family transcriptional regulator [Roseomonas sp. OT10]UFN48419.1 GntR family transcriptional regulator [Roseomonas sp. OT10]